MLLKKQMLPSRSYEVLSARRNRRNMIGQAQGKPEFSG